MKNPNTTIKSKLVKDTKSNKVLTPEEQIKLMNEAMASFRKELNETFDTEAIAVHLKEKKELERENSAKAKEAIRNIKDAKWIAEVTIKQIEVSKSGEVTELTACTQTIDLLDANKVFTKGTTAHDRTYTEEEVTKGLNIRNDGSESAYKKEQNLVDKRAFNQITSSVLNSNLEIAMDLQVLTAHKGILGLRRNPQQYQNYLDGTTDELQYRKDATHSTKPSRDALKNKLQQEAKR